MVLKVDKMVKDGPSKRLKIVLRCSGTVGVDNDETLDLILQVHSDVLVSPLHTIVMSSPHDGELGTEQWSGGNSGSGVSEPPSSQL